MYIVPTLFLRLLEALVERQARCARTLARQWLLTCPTLDLCTNICLNGHAQRTIPSIIVRTSTCTPTGCNNHVRRRVAPTATIYYRVSLARVLPVETCPLSRTNAAVGWPHKDQDCTSDKASALWLQFYSGDVRQRYLTNFNLVAEAASDGTRCANAATPNNLYKVPMASRTFCYSTEATLMIPGADLIALSAGKLMAGRQAVVTFHQLPSLSLGRLGSATYNYRPWPFGSLGRQ